MRDEIIEYSYQCTSKRIVQGKGDNPDEEVLLYDGECDEHMVNEEVGRTLQTSTYIISIPLTKDENDKWIVPRKGDQIELTRYDETFTLTVDNSEPSQLGGVSIYSSRNSW